MRIKPPTLKKTTFLLLIALLFLTNQSNAQDWRLFYGTANIDKFRADNIKLGPPVEGENRVVFMGNSITEAWPVLRPDFFKDNPYIARGISGQTTPQMLLRFRNDVISLQPKVVVILAGVNDIAQNTGIMPIPLIAENIMSMAELARYHNMEVILCSVVPAIDFPWKRGLEPANKIIELNALIKDYAKKNELTYVDYHAAMADDQNGLKVPEYTSAEDLVHPNEAGYVLMETLLQPAIKKALAASSLTLPSLFSDHMVLQQKESVAIWGKAAPNEQIMISGSWGSQSKTTADANGNWKQNLSTPIAGGPYELTISTSKDIRKINEVMIGEVWLASGQSNMSMPLKGWPPADPIDNSKNEIANAQYPNIRMFTVANKFSFEEEHTLNGSWQVCNDSSAENFSATAYFFARKLHNELNIPIGIIHSSWGGSPAESWVSKQQLRQLADFNETLTAIDNPNRKQSTKDWYAPLTKQRIPEKPEEWNQTSFIDLSIVEPTYNDQDWKTMTLPGRLDLINGQDLDGIFWFRKTIQLDNIESDYTFEMGAVDDIDAVYINGKKIGGTTNNYKDGRIYKISKNQLNKGENTIAIRIIDTGGPGSIQGEMKLNDSKSTSVSVEGSWKYLFIGEMYNNQVYVGDNNGINLSSRPNIISEGPFKPTALYNAMIHPLRDYNIKGAIWYQGESNVGRAEQYERLFPLMIKNWRTQWNTNFPFYFVQIAPFQYQGTGNPELDLSQKLRDAQRKSLTIEKTGMAVTLDIGNYKNIHPANKQDVGARLANLALANDYGKKIEASGPLYKNHSIKRKKMILDFEHKGTGLVSNQTMLSGFEIAGADKKFVRATAIIKRNKVYLSSKKITKPKYARYAWSDKGLGSLKNNQNLPASSFTTE